MAASGTRPEVAGVAISHPDRIVYPELGLSKLDLESPMRTAGPIAPYRSKHGKTDPAREHEQ
jgi:hypothetical protein